jgi:ketosteroid isomerase-like protein
LRENRRRVLFDATDREESMTARLLLLMTTPVLLGCSATARHEAVPAEDDAVVVRQLEEKVAAATERNDANALDPYLAPDFTFVNPVGALVTKERFLNNMRTGVLRNTSYTVDEMQVRIYGTAAVVTYRSVVEGTAGAQQIAQGGAGRRCSSSATAAGSSWRSNRRRSSPDRADLELSPA